MLVLSRRPGEVLVMKLKDGREVEVIVTKVKGNRVTIGVQAPLDVKVRRGELRAA